MEHLAGRGADRLVRLIHSRRLRTWKIDAAPLKTAEHLKRFTLLASAVAQREVRVVDMKGDPPPRPYLPILRRTAHPALLADHGFARTDGECVFLPVSLVDMSTAEDQERLARLTVFFLSAQIRCGSLCPALSHKALLSSDTLVADLYWIIENTRLSSLLSREYPGLLRDRDVVTSLLLKRRPPARLLSEAEAEVESFLAASIKGETSLSPGSASESLASAVTLKERWTREGLRSGRYRAMVPFAPWGRLIPERLNPAGVSGPSQRQKRETAAGPYNDRELDNGETRREDRGRYNAVREDVDEEANEQGLLLNIYDKIISWAEFVNVNRQFDDDPEGGTAPADEMEELTTATLKRPARTLFDADLVHPDEQTNEAALEPGPATSTEVRLYPEWDYKKAALKEDFARLFVEDAPGESTAFVDRVLAARRGLIREVGRRFEALSHDSRPMSRRLDGDRVDIDATVEAATELKAGRQPSERLYISAGRCEREISTLFLVDTSMSTDAWINNARVIDHEKEALVVLCEAMEKLKDRYAVCSFSGRTRTHCRFFNIKGFDAPYGREVKARIGSLVPLQYTRMGPAIRHATTMLEEEPSRIRLLFIISDGKPNDIDCYEGRYGVEDTRDAVARARMRGVVPFCITVESGPRDYLPRIFGTANYCVLPDVERLALKLPGLYAAMVRLLSF